VTAGRRGEAHAGNHSDVLGVELGPADVAQPHEVTLVLAQDHVVELLCRPQVGLRYDGELAVGAFDAARRDLDVLAAQGALDLLHRQPVGSEPGLVEPDAHGVAALAEDAYGRHAIDGLQLVLDHAVYDIGHFDRAQPFAQEGKIDDREGVGLDLGDDRLVDLGRQLGADT
jgi:hypothetical protein